MIWFRNFVHTLRRFLLASVTNLLGLAVAFGAFYVIMTQVDYDSNYDKGYDGYQNIIRIDIQTGSDVSSRQLWICLPMANMIAECSPHIVGHSCLQGYNQDDELWIGDKKMGVVDIVGGFDDFIAAFHPKMIVGETSAMLGHKVLIPYSLAMRCFGRADCVGESIHIGEKSAGEDVEVGGVFQDFPSNSTLRNGVYFSYSEEQVKSEDNWQQYNYNLYLRLDDADAADDVVKAAYDQIVKNAPASVVGDDDEVEGSICYTRMEDVHFSNVGGPAESSPTTLFLLLIISIAVVGVAAINFMNFSLAETPMRIRSINTQKVLGASVASLRANLVLESVVVCLVAVVLGGVAVMVGRNFGLQDIVQGDISLSQHPLLVALTVGVAVVAGLLAGIYPAFYATSIPPAVALKGDFGLSKSGRSLRTLLLGVQFIVAFALVVCISIMYAQMRHISTTNYGLDKDSIIMGVTTRQIYQHRDAVRSELMSISGIENFGFSGFTMGGDSYPAWGRGKDDHVIHFYCLRCDCHFLETMGIKIVEGRDFNETDNGAFIFNKAAMEEYPWLAVGQIPWQDGDDDFWPIVGVCDNIRFRSMRYGNNAPMAFCVFPKENDWFMGKYNIRVAKGVDMKEIMDTLHKTLDKYYDDGNADLKFMNDRLNLLYKSETRFSSQILLFSVIAIIISLMGVMGISMFEAEYRRKEIAVRKVLGCDTHEVVMMFVRRYVLILAVCFVIGAPLGYILSQHWLSGFADRVDISPLVFLFSLVSVSVLTLATVTLQVWRAARANPVDAIKG